MKYVFIAEHEDAFCVSGMCDVLNVSRSGYYDWCVREPSEHARQDVELLKDIRREFEKGRHQYGSPKVWKALRHLGKRHSRKRVARLMAENGLFARKKKRFVRTTRANPAHQPTPNVLNREFDADQPNRKWVSEIGCTQMTKTGGFAGWRSRDRVMNLNLLAVNDDPVDEEFDQASFLFEGGVLQADLNPFTELFNPSRRGQERFMIDCLAAELLFLPR